MHPRHASKFLSRVEYPPLFDHLSCVKPLYHGARYATLF